MNFDLDMIMRSWYKGKIKIMWLKILIENIKESSYFLAWKNNKKLTAVFPLLTLSYLNKFKEKGGKIENKCQNFILWALYGFTG